MNLHIDDLNEWAASGETHKPTQAFNKRVAEEEAKQQRIRDAIEKRKETDAHPHPATQS